MNSSHARTVQLTHLCCHPSQKLHSTCQSCVHGFQCGSMYKVLLSFLDWIHLICFCPSQCNTSFCVSYSVTWFSDCSRTLQGKHWLVRNNLVRVSLSLSNNNRRVWCNVEEREVECRSKLESLPFPSLQCVLALFSRWVVTWSLYIEFGGEMRTELAWKTAVPAGGELDIQIGSIVCCRSWLINCYCFWVA